MARLFGSAALRSGVPAAVVVGLTLVTDVNAGLVGLLLVLVGGLVAGIALVNPPNRAAGYEAGAAPMLETLDPLARSEDGGSPLVRRFLFGLGLVVAGAVTVVVLGS